MFIIKYFRYETAVVNFSKDTFEFEMKIVFNFNCRFLRTRYSKLLKKLQSFPTMFYQNNFKDEIEMRRKHF